MNDTIDQWEQEISEQLGLEALNEFEIYRDNELSIHIDPSTQRSGFGYSPYIKVYHRSYKLSKDELRIELDDGHIVDTHTDRGKKFDNMKMTKKLATNLTDIINNKSCNRGPHTGEQILDAINNELDNIYRDTKIKVNHIEKVDLSNYYTGPKRKEVK